MTPEGRSAPTAVTVMPSATGGGTYWSYPSNHHETATEAAARPSHVPRSETPPSTAPPSAAYPSTAPSSPPHPSASATPAASIAAAAGRGTWSSPPCWWQRSHAHRAAATGTSCRGRRGGARTGRTPPTITKLPLRPPLAPPTSRAQRPPPPPPPPPPPTPPPCPLHPPTPRPPPRPPHPSPPLLAEALGRVRRVGGSGATRIARPPRGRRVVGDGGGRRSTGTPPPRHRRRRRQLGRRRRRCRGCCPVHLGPAGRLIWQSRRRTLAVIATHTFEGDLLDAVSLFTAAAVVAAVIITAATTAAADDGGGASRRRGRRRP